MAQKRKNLTQLSQTEQLANKRSRRNGEDVFEGPSTSQGRSQGRAGRVLKICLRNFMCHSSLQVKLDPNTNYIIGRNGSGKSAILTALIVGLGGKARLTNRGANMQAFIKVGQTSAFVEITLTNTGPAAYNPAELGHEITITRSFTATGGNSYKLKSASGETISTSLREIVRVIEALNIHVDNPICILNQDVARTFLNTNDPGKKYEMFMKATCLDNVKSEYKIAVKNKNDTVGLLQTKLDALKILEAEVKKWLKKYKAFEAMSDIERRKNMLEIESVWAQINGIEQELREKEEKLEEISKDLQSFTDLVQNKEDRKKEMNEKIEEIRQQLLEIRNMEEANRSLMEDKRKTLNKLRETFVGKKNEITAIENMINRKNADKKNIEDEISNSSTNQNNRLKIIEERDAKMVSLEKKMLDIKKMFETAENELLQTRSALDHKRSEENNIKKELEHLNENIRHRQAKIRSMKSDENNSTSVYGGNMHRIMHAINAAKEQFSKLPRGPVGSYIKLKDKKWALPIEDFVSQGMLMSFCVDNQKDAKVLGRIFSEAGGGHKPTIICSKFHDRIHNFSRNKVEAPHGCITMIDAMVIKDPVITNCLIDQLSIETVLLISTNDLARQLMSDAARVPKHCTRAVTLCGDQFYPDPNYRSYSCRNKQPRFLQVSVADVIRNYEEEVKNFMQNHEVVDRQTKSVSQDALRLSREVQALQNKIIKLETAQGKIQREINDLKFQVLPSEPNIEILAEEMKEISKIIESKQNDLQKISEDVETIKQQIKDVESEYLGLKQISKGLESRMTPLLEEVADIETMLKQTDINTRRHTEKIEQCKQKVKETKKECEKKKKFLGEKLQAAEPLGSRMETNRPLEVVLAELQDTDQQLTTIRTTMGDKMVVSQEYMRYQDKYDKTKERVDQIQACVDQMNKTLESRARNYQKLAEYIGVRVREMFTGVLKMRQFKGTIEIDHEKHTLQLVVIPQHGASQGTGQTHILSGGERSFSTVAFLHALWQVTEHPFYFLDEFDVFMDKVNRRTVMDILLEHAKEHKELQFVFLTPQDISSVIGNNDITVHRMADPERSAAPK